MGRPRKSVETEGASPEYTEMDLIKTSNDRHNIIASVAMNLFLKYLDTHETFDGALNDAISDAIKFADAIDKME